MRGCAEFLLKTSRQFEFPDLQRCKEVENRVQREKEAEERRIQEERERQEERTRCEAEARLDTNLKVRASRRLGSRS